MNIIEYIYGLDCYLGWAFMSVLGWYQVLFYYFLILLSDDNLFKSRQCHLDDITSQ